MCARRVLVTGASGFVGRTVCKRLRHDGWDVRPTGYRNVDDGIPSIPVAPDTDWSEAVAGCDAVVHLAARAHVLREDADDPLAAFTQVNTDGAITLGRAAAASGVHRFLFMSSIAVHGAQGDNVLRSTDTLEPATPYGISKLGAELELAKIAGGSGMELTILRPPLVYGPGVGARFLQLLRWTRRGIPLPFSAVDNRRSLVGVHNLADAVSTALVHPSAAGRTYLVADDEAISTPDLIGELAHGMARRARLVPVPPALLRLAARIVGRSEELDRLISSLVVDAGPIRRELSWRPPMTLKAGLEETARWFEDRESRR